MWLWQGHPSPMPGWGLCGGPSLQEQQWVPWTLFLPVRGLVTCWLNGRFTVLLSTCGFGSCGPPVSPRLGTNTAVLSLCVPASQARTLGLGRHRVAQSSLTTERLSLSASCGPCPAQLPGRGSVPKRPCVFLLPAASEYLSSGKAHESPGKVGGAGGSLSSEPCSLCGP